MTPSFNETRACARSAALTRKCWRSGWRICLGASGLCLGGITGALTLLGRLWGVRLPLGARLWEADHVTPIAEGGSDELTNLRTLCKRCHRQESASLLGRLARRPTKGVGRGFA